MYFTLLKIEWCFILTEPFKSVQPHMKCSAVKCGWGVYSIWKENSRVHFLIDIQNYYFEEPS